MTSTSIYQGNFGEKPSSRVMRPPGGGSSNIFGTPDVKPVQPTTESKCLSETAPVAAVVSAVPSATPAVTDAIKPAPVDAGPSKRMSRDGGFNPITGEAYGHDGTVPRSDGRQAPSIAVKQPPGGASTKLW